jgi:hypothetical protein
VVLRALGIEKIDPPSPPRQGETDVVTNRMAGLTKINDLCANKGNMGANKGNTG